MQAPIRLLVRKTRRAIRSQPRSRRRKRKIRRVRRENTNLNPSPHRQRTGKRLEGTESEAPTNNES